MELLPIVLIGALVVTATHPWLAALVVLYCMTREEKPVKPFFLPPPTEPDPVIQGLIRSRAAFLAQQSRPKEPSSGLHAQSFCSPWS